MWVKLSQFFSQVSGKTNNILKLHVRYKGINIKQQAQATYLGCVLEESKCCQTMEIVLKQKQWETKISLPGKSIFMTGTL